MLVGSYGILVHEAQVEDILCAVWQAAWVGERHDAPRHATRKLGLRCALLLPATDVHDVELADAVKGEVAHREVAVHLLPRAGRWRHPRTHHRLAVHNAFVLVLEPVRGVHLNQLADVGESKFLNRTKVNLDVVNIVTVRSAQPFLIS